MKLLNNHYFSTLSCYNTRLLDSLQAKFLRLPSRSRPFILPCSCKFSVCPKNKVSVFRFMKKNCIFLYFFLSQKRCKECALAHSGVSRGRLRHVSASRECASSRSIFCFIGHISYETKNLQSIRMRITFLIQTNWRFSISPSLPLGFIYHLFLAL